MAPALAASSLLSPRPQSSPGATSWSWRRADRTQEEHRARPSTRTRSLPAGARSRRRWRAPSTGPGSGLSIAQFAGGVPAKCDGVTQGQAGMELSLFSRDVIALAAAIALSMTCSTARCSSACATRSCRRWSWAALSFGYGTANSNQMRMEIVGLHLPALRSSIRTCRSVTRLPGRRRGASPRSRHWATTVGDGDQLDWRPRCARAAIRASSRRPPSPSTPMAG